MFRIVCTSEQEKVQWLEASEAISKVKDLDTTHPVVKFLTKLCRDPGSIEVVEKMVLPTESRPSRGPRGNFRPGYSNFRGRV